MQNTIRSQSVTRCFVCPTEGMTSHHKMQGVPFQKKGKTYWNITDFDFEFGVQHMKCHFDGLMKGNPEVSK